MSGSPPSRWTTTRRPARPLAVRWVSTSSLVSVGAVHDASRPGCSRGIEGLRPARHDLGRGQRGAQGVVETGALGGGEPRPRPEAGAQHHRVDPIGDHLLRRGHRGIEIAEQLRGHGRTVHDAGTPPREHLGLLLPSAVAGDADGVSSERTSGRGAHLPIVAARCFRAVSVRCRLMRVWRPTSPDVTSVRSRSRPGCLPDPGRRSRPLPTVAGSAWHRSH